VQPVLLPLLLPLPLSIPLSLPLASLDPSRFYKARALRWSQPICT
jgi:hypothetical protein